MALDVGTLVVTLTADDSGLRTKMQSAKAGMADLDQAAGKASRSLVAVGDGFDGQKVKREADQASSSMNALGAATELTKKAAIGIGAAFTLDKAVTFMKDAVMAASDLSESTNKVQQVFKSGARDIEAFGATAAKSIGMSNLAAREAASTFGVFGKSAGLSGKDLVGFSTNLTKLAGDMASFSNTTPEEAIEALGAALRGENEPIQRYGVLLDDATLRQEAMKQGLIATTKDALTPAQKVLSAYGVVMAQTKDSQGDFGRTSTGLANQMRILKAEFTNTSAEIGSNLLPIAESFVSLLAGPGMAAFGATADVLKVIGTAVGTLGSAFGSLPGPVQGVIGAIVALKVAQAALGTEIGQKFTGKLADARESLVGLGRSAASGPGAMLSSLRETFAAAGGQAEGFGNKLKAAGTVGVGAMRSGLSSLIGLMGGPLGIAITGATLAFAQHAAAVADAKAQTEQIGTAVKGVADEMGKSGGKYTDAGQKAAAAALSQIKLRDGTTSLSKALSDMHIPLDTAAQGLAGLGKSADKTLESLKAQKAEQESQLSGWERFKQGVGIVLDDPLSTKPVNQQYKTQGGDALKAYEEARKQIKEQQDQLQRDADAGAFTLDVAPNGKKSISDMSQAMADLAENGDGAANAVKILSTTLDKLMSDGLTMDDALQGWNDGLAELRTAAAEVNGPLFDLAGNVNSANTSVSAFYSQAKTGASDMHAVAAAAQQQGASFQGIVDAVQPMYDEFVRMAQAAGIPQPEIDKLAAKLNMVPTDLALKIEAGDLPVTSQLADILRGKIVDIPDSKHIEVSDNSPEIIKKLQDLGLKVDTLPNGHIVVTTNAAQAGKEVDDVANKPRQAFIDVYQRMITGANTPEAQKPRTGGLAGLMLPNNANGSVRRYANGGISGALPDRAVMQPAVPGGLVQWAEGETEGESFIPHASSKRARSLKIWAETGRILGVFANGGITGSLIDLARKQAPGLQVTDSFRAGANDYHGSGNAVDFSNGSGNTDEQLAWANYLADHHAAELAELIYDDPRFTRNIKNGKVVDRSFYAGAGDHTNHVHVAAKAPLTGNKDARTERERVVDAIVAEGRRRGISDKGIKTAIAAGLAESNLQDLPDIPNSEYDSAGVFQQRPSMGWGPAGQGVTQDAGDFYERLAQLDYEGMDPAAAAQSVQRSAFSDGSNYQAKLSEADQVFADSMARNGNDTSTAPTPDSSSRGGSVQDVYVTNWPGGYSPTGSGDTGMASGIGTPVSAPASPVDEQAPEGPKGDPLLGPDGLFGSGSDLVAAANMAGYQINRAATGKSGPPMGRSMLDVFPILAAKGERVIDAETNAKFGPILDALVKDKVPGYFFGGTVGSNPNFMPGGSKHNDTVKAWLGAGPAGGGALSTIAKANPAVVRGEQAYRGAVGAVGAIIEVASLLSGMASSGISGLGFDVAKQLLEHQQGQGKPQGGGSAPVGQTTRKSDTAVGAQFFGPVQINDAEGFLTRNADMARDAFAKNNL
ncbi:phage tail protein [Rhodococcus daqingensis]|uniref:Tape measure protein n=1 Tax=Rhodococcus daqingensis TaxID=2479363 RepID=A0ABW2RXT9_9NOCA